MIPFKTTDDEILKLSDIVVEMQKAGLDRGFIARAYDLAREDQGVFDLMSLWSSTNELEEREEIVADIQASIDDYADTPSAPLDKP